MAASAQKLLLRLYRACFASPRFYWLNRSLLRASLTGLGVLNSDNDRDSGEAHFVRCVLPRFIDLERPVLVDVGANVGSFSRLLAEQFPSARICAFEPNPTVFERLEAARGPSIDCHAMALGDEEGQFPLFDHFDGSGTEHASLHGAVITEQHCRAARAVEVPVRRLDRVMAELGIERIDFLKIDTEGNELAVLRGASQLIERRAIGVIQFEFNEMNVISHVFLRDFRLLLGGYSMFRLLPAGLLPLDDAPWATEVFGFQNVIAVPREAVARVAAAQSVTTGPPRGSSPGRVTFT